jgi:hypothetical protein
MPKEHGRQKGMLADFGVRLATIATTLILTTAKSARSRAVFSTEF